MFCMPDPNGVRSGSKPRPSSVTSKVRVPSPTPTGGATTRLASAYLATFCSASRQQKYTAASASCGYRPMPSAWTSTGTAALRACASSADASPWSASSGG